MKRLFSFVIAVSAIAGCGSKEEAPPVITDAKAQLEKVKNDPALTDAQRDLYTRQLEARALFDEKTKGQGQMSNIRPGQ